LRIGEEKRRKKIETTAAKYNGLWAAIKNILKRNKITGAAIKL